MNLGRFKKRHVNTVQKMYDGYLSSYDGTPVMINLIIMSKKETHEIK